MLPVVMVEWINQSMTDSVIVHWEYPCVYIKNSVNKSRTSIVTKNTKYKLVNDHTKTKADSRKSLLKWEKLFVRFQTGGKPTGSRKILCGEDVENSYQHH